MSFKKKYLCRNCSHRQNNSGKIECNDQPDNVSFPYAEYCPNYEGKNIKPLKDLTFETICKERQASAGEKYLDADGNNVGYHRDNAEDILEELADAYNIANIWCDRLSSTPYTSEGEDVYVELLELAEMIKGDCKFTAGSIIEAILDKKYPQKLKDENIIRPGIDYIGTSDE